MVAAGSISTVGSPGSVCIPASIGWVRSRNTTTSPCQTHKNYPRPVAAVTPGTVLSGVGSHGHHRFLSDIFCLCPEFAQVAKTVLDASIKFLAVFEAFSCVHFMPRKTNTAWNDFVNLPEDGPTFVGLYVGRGRCVRRNRVMSRATSPSRPTLHGGLRDAATHSLSLVTRGVRAAAFWTAVVLPLLYVPALYSVEPALRASVVAALLTINLLSVVIGHSYPQS